MDPTDSESCGRDPLYKADKQASRHPVTVRLNVRMAKMSDLSDFEPGMVIGARHARSSISETATPKAFHAQQCLGFTKNGATNKKTFTQRQSCEKKQLVDER
jgi:hypothetical protein